MSAGEGQALLFKQNRTPRLAWNLPAEHDKSESLVSFRQTEPDTQDTSAWQLMGFIQKFPDIAGIRN